MNLRAHDGHAARDDLNDRGAAMIRLHLSTLRLRCAVQRRYHQAADRTDPPHCARCGGRVRGWTLTVVDRFDVFEDGAA